jgi:hypothetical protein
MPIDAAEKRLFDRVDGVRTLGEIADDVPAAMARDFFERLGWWDQVVFDSSRQGPGQVERDGPRNRPVLPTDS